MTITDEQLQRDKKYFFEFAQSDEAGLDFAQIKFCETMVAYISEVERLRAEVRILSRLKAETDSFASELDISNKALQAENAELKSKYARVIALGNLENYIGDVIDKPIKYSEEK